jgi:membrane protease YdiL (CAAX protease family)
MRFYKKRKTIVIINITLLILLGLVYYLKQSSSLLFVDEQITEMVIATIYRVIIGFFFLNLMLHYGYKFYSFRMKRTDLLYVVVPGILIAINNFPISAYVNNRFIFTTSSLTILIVLLFTLGTAFLEEIVFRSVIFTTILQLFPNTKKGIFLSIISSSIFFGLMHLINIFEGAGVTNTLLQVGYSFLMGCLWTVVFLKTKSIWSSVLLHWLYNFFGFVLFEVGVLYNRYDTITIITTILVGVVGVVYYYYVFIQINMNDLQDFAYPTLVDSND